MNADNANSSSNVLITGATSGLGKQLAIEFWKNGWNMLVVGRSEVALNELAQTVESQPGQHIFFIKEDLAYPEAVSRIVNVAKQKFTKLDALINNAATQGPIGPAWENSEQEWQSTLQVNLLAPVALCRAMVPWMMEYGEGSIINLSGGGAAGPRPNFSAYATAKAGLVRFSETLAEELKPHKVRVNCVAPGAMPTPMLQKIIEEGQGKTTPKEYDLALKVLMAGNSLSIQRASELIRFLASTASKEITGKLISAVWDDWQQWNYHLDELNTSDLYTLRRVTGRDRGCSWGDMKEEQ